MRWRTQGPSLLFSLSVIFSGVALTTIGAAFQPSGPASPGLATQGTSKPGAASVFRLEDGTPVKLRLQRTISSADAQVDERIDFDVLEEIQVNDLVVVPKGSVAWGTVTDAQAKRRMGRGGKLDINIDAVRLADGEKAALRGVKDLKGGGHTGAMTAGMVATSLVVWPAAPFFLFMHGKDITIPKGTEINVYINGDMNLDAAKFGGKPSNEAMMQPAGTANFPPQPATQSTAPASVASENLATVATKSNPDGADFTVDGKYMGSTPSTVRLTPGDHTISIQKSGFKDWQRTMTVSPGGSITIDANLEKTP
jgi:PEGA domain-containing protein